MTIDLRADEQDLMTGEFPKLVERQFDDGPTGVHTEYGIVFGNRDTTVTLWYRTEGERQMMMQTADILTQR